MVHLNERNMAARILDDLDCLNPSTDFTEDMTALEVDDSDVFTLMKGFRGSVAALLLECLN